MSFVLLLGLVAAGLAIRVIIAAANRKSVSESELRTIPLVGSAAFMMGILAQAIGLYQAMSAIQAVGDVSPALVAGGFQVSMIAPIFGLILFIFSLFVYLILRVTFTKSDVGKA